VKALSNWRFVYNPGDPNHVPLAYSNFDIASLLRFADEALASRSAPYPGSHRKQ